MRTTSGLLLAVAVAAVLPACPRSPVVQRLSLNCCTPEKPCDVGGGDCGKDADCKGHLKCGDTNCSRFRPDNYKRADCCYDPERQPDYATGYLSLDGSCGPQNGGAECDGKASGYLKGPCCSNRGYCGATAAYCQCDGCVHFGFDMVPIEKCRTDSRGETQCKTAYGTTSRSLLALGGLWTSQANNIGTNHNKIRTNQYCKSRAGRTTYKNGEYARWCLIRNFVGGPRCPYSC